MLKDKRQPLTECEIICLAPQSMLVKVVNQALNNNELCR